MIAQLSLSAVTFAQTDSFESGKLGVINTELKGPLGIWQSKGTAEISSRRAVSGLKALRIFGGNEQSIVLNLPEPRTSGFVRLRAERWTRRSPFVFTIDVHREGGWETVYKDLGSRIIVGAYHANIEFRVDGQFDSIRLTCTSPDGGGVLIDDFTVESLQPMRIVEVTTEQPVLPILVGNRINPIARVRVTTVGTTDPINVNGIHWQLDSKMERCEINKLTVYTGVADSLDSNDPDNCFEDEDAFGDSVDASKRVDFVGSRILQRGDNYFWLSVELNSATDIDGWIDASCLDVIFSDGTTIIPEVTSPDGVQRFGVALRNAGDDGINAYRIPGIITTQAGTLIAVYDIRHNGWGDLPNDIDVGMSRSTDGGKTWEPMQTILDMGDDPEWRFDGVGDPSILYDETTRTIWVAATWSHGDRSWNGSGPGFKPEETGQLMLVKSEDDGLTWSDPINITRQIKDADWAFVLPSPGRGITMTNGTLVFPAQYQLHPDQGRMPYSTIISSDDHGKTWHIGNGAKPNTTECQVVELEPGTLMLNMRDNRGGSRAVHISRDLGTTWQVHSSSRGLLPEPVCNAGLISVRKTWIPGRPWLVFANPNTTNAPRRNMTIKLSPDGGLTWPISQQLLLDEGISAGYPSLTMIDEDTVGILYESSRSHLAFQRIPIVDFAHE